MPRLLKKDETSVVATPKETTEKESVQMKGKVVYLDPHYYPSDKITYYLEDDAGKQMILLKTDDQKLAVVEGLKVIVFGEIEKTKDSKEDVLNVEKIVVKN